MSQAILSPRWFQEHYNYDPDTGKISHKITKELLWLLSPGGYIFVTLQGRQYLAHRIAWAIQTGEWPNQIDHINHNKEDNRWVNLRESTFTGNNRNRPLQYRNTSGIHRVSYNEKTQRWRATIGHNRKQIYLGSFLNKEEAIKARLKAEIELGYHPNHGKD